MSLTQLIEVKEIKEKLGVLRPSVCLIDGGSIKVPPSSNRYSLLGIAFDYLLRFELHRRCPHAVAATWIAELAPEVLRPVKDVWVVVFPELDNRMSPEDVYHRLGNILKIVRTTWEAYLKLKTPSISDQRTMAKHSLLLAKLDSLYRSRLLASDFESVDVMDVDELIALLGNVPFSEFPNDSHVLLNPSFGSASTLVGNADADLVIGEMLIDIKTTKERTIGLKMHNQLLGYYFLAKKHRIENPLFPMIKQVGIYFSRYGMLWRMGVEQWTSNPKFSEVEEYFFKEAAKMFPTSTSLP